jgi:hypothetical protein
MKSSIIIVAAMLACCAAFGAVGFYVPAGAGTNDGNSSLAGPFDTSSSSRLQQVYGHGAFPTIAPDSAFLIRQITFRGDERALPIFGSAHFPSVEVHLSTTSLNPDGISVVFNENIGADEKTVLGPGPVDLAWSAGRFATFITLDRPFFYNPVAGNLLLDIRNYGPSTFAPLDAYDLPGDSLSITIGRADATTGFSAVTRGLATFFTLDIVPIPEPSTTALLLLSGALALGWKCRRSLRSSSTQG